MTEYNEMLFGDRSQRLNRALKLFGKNRDDLEQDVKIMTEWLKTQRHLPEMTNENILKNMLILNKFSIEKCKENVDMYYTMRSLIPELFANKNPKLPHMKIAAKIFYHVTMPTETEEGYRVTYLGLLSTIVGDFQPYDVVAHSYNMSELKLLNDVVIGDIYVLDMANYSFAHISKVTPVHLKKMLALSEKVFKNLLKQMHFVNVPPYVEGIVNLIKQMVKPKLANRIFAHKSGEDLKKYLPIDVLPKEYGGNEYNLEELNELWLEEMRKHQYRFDELEKLKIDESKRPAPLINDEILGFHGNFKKLNVD